MSTDTRPIWTPTTPDERRHIAVAEMVEHVLAAPEDYRYAVAYGTLAALVTSSDPTMAEWAREFVTEAKRAMNPK